MQSEFPKTETAIDNETSHKDRTPTEILARISVDEQRKPYADIEDQTSILNSERERTFTNPTQNNLYHI